MTDTPRLPESVSSIFAELKAATDIKGVMTALEKTEHLSEHDQAAFKKGLQDRFNFAATRGKDDFEIVTLKCWDDQPLNANNFKVVYRSGK